MATKFSKDLNLINEDLGSGFRSAMDLFVYKQSISPLYYTSPKVFLTKIDLRFYTWNPSELVEKVKKNIPLRFVDYCSPFLLKYADWLERVCLQYRTATGYELLAILSKLGRISIGEFQILL